MGIQFEKAFSSWSAILPEKNILFGENSREYALSTLLLGGRQAHVFGVLIPENIKEIVKIVEIANKYKIPLYPISVGNNWGYGSRVPIQNGSVVLDLSRMNTITLVEPTLGLISVEPGVTPKQLEVFLSKNKINFLTPVTGAGPHGSVLGNILEKGHGTSSFIDRFQSLVSLTAVLGDGTIYNRSSNDYPVFKWGTGPYIDGLFAQSNMGIVVSAVVALAPLPEDTQILLFSPQNKLSLSKIIPLVHTILSQFTGVVSSIRIMNARRVLTWLMAYPDEKSCFDKNGVLLESFIEKKINEVPLSFWTVLIVLQGKKSITTVAKKEIKKYLLPFARKLSVYDQKKSYFLSLIKGISLPLFIKKRVIPPSFVEVFYNLACGKNEKNNPLSPFWKIKNAKSLVSTGYYLNEHPNAGLIFFSARIPMISPLVEDFSNQVNLLCKKHGVEPIFSLTNFSDRCLYFNLPILFDKKNLSETRRAHLCYKELVACAKDHNVSLHRLPTEFMDLVVNTDDSFWKLARKIKKVFDPNSVISPKRYSL